jgi:hypothetical protein
MPAFGQLLASIRAAILSRGIAKNSGLGIQNKFVLL